MLPPTLAKADLHLLYVFTTVVRSRGFAAAQVELNVSPSTISRQISHLETRLGMTLCNRGRSGFRLTHKGEVVFRAAQRLFASIKDFSETVDGSRGKLVGNLSVAVIDNWVFNDASPFQVGLREFVHKAPDVTLELFSLAPADIEIAVQDGNVSLGVGVFHRPKPGLIYEALTTERMGLYCARGHSLFDVTDHTKLPALLQQSNYAKRTYLNEASVAPVSQGMFSNGCAHQIEGIAHLILTGRYIGYLPEHFAEFWLKEGGIKSVGDGQFDQVSQIKLVFKRGAELNRVTQTLADLIRAGCVAA